MLSLQYVLLSCVFGTGLVHAAQSIHSGVFPAAFRAPTEHWFEELAARRTVSKKASPKTVATSTRFVQTTKPAGVTQSVKTSTVPLAPPITASSTSGGAAALPNNAEVANTALFQQNILQQHNSFRALFGVPALSWNPNLAAFAQNWVNTCKYYHSIEAYPNPPWNGENIAAAAAGSSADLNDYGSALPIQLWGVNEFKHYSYNPRTSRDDEITGHFQNMVWRSFNSLGCAVAFCPNGLTNDAGAAIFTSPALSWSCDFGLPDNTSDWSVEYNVPRNISVVY